MKLRTGRNPAGAQHHSLRAAPFGVALVMGMARSALADAKDCEIQLLDREVKQGAAGVVDNKRFSAHLEQCCLLRRGFEEYRILGHQLRILGQ